MTPEEIRLLKDGVDVFDYPKNSLVRKAIEHIDEQAKKNKVLKEALVEERAWHFIIGGADECIVPDEEYPCSEDCYCVDDPQNCPAKEYLWKVSREQLKRELPEIEWND